MSPVIRAPSHLSRRSFTQTILRASGAMLVASPMARAQKSAPALGRGIRPLVTHGVASGDVSANAAIIWSRADQRARMIVEWSTTEGFQERRRVVGPVTHQDDDFTVKLELTDLPPGQRIFYRVQFEDRVGGRNTSDPATGQFVTAPYDERDVFFAWSGDTCGQGYGIDESRGGLKTYAALRRLRPDFFIHSGDTIYADGPLSPEVTLPDGSVWKNLVTEEKSKVAETLAEFRGNHRYNLLDANVRDFNADVALFGQWDDHEVRNNWYPSQVLDDKKYRIKEVSVLAQNARRAFLDYWPLRPTWRGRIFRRIPRGPLCEVFMIDLRSYRAANSPNRQERRSAETRFFGDRQLAWLKGALSSSRATWKIIASDMPIGLVVGDGKNFENGANGAGPALGRELEIAELLRFIQEKHIRNTIWLTADVHYAASHYYDPSKAQFTQFDPFWEFVSGPLHAASLGPGALDNTFGPQAKWNARPKGSKASGPYSAEQFFGTIRIDGKTRTAMVTHYDRDGGKLHSTELPAVLEKS